jgi:hypothetical protein
VNLKKEIKMAIKPIGQMSKTPNLESKIKWQKN